MRKISAVLCLAFLLVLSLVEGDSQGSPTHPLAPEEFFLADRRVEVAAESGRLIFQAKDEAGNPYGEPWFWPEDGSPLSYEDPQILEKGGEIWLTFVERSPAGSVRSRSVSLSEIFSNGFEAGTTAAWSSTEPAVNLSIVSPPQDAAVGDATPLIEVLYATPTGLAINPATLAFTVGGSPLAVSCTPVPGGAECVPSAAFADGQVTIGATVADVAGHVSPAATRRFTVDTAPPALTVTSPTEGFLTASTSIAVTGSVSETATLTLNAAPVALGPGNSFSTLAALAEGANVLVVAATDLAGNTVIVSRSGTSDTLAPAPVSAALVASARKGSKVEIEGAPGAAEGESRVRWRNPRTGAEVEVSAAADGSFSASIGGADGDVLVAIVIDALGHESPPAYFPVDYLVPPDPTPFAPPLDTTVAYDLFDAISFLFEGADAIQKEVTPGAIEERRIAWLRGTVRQRGGAPLAGAKVSVLGHPELGHTLSRADGVFDLVVNGGGVVTLEFERAGFLPIQRQEVMRWRDSTVIDDVVLLGLDPVATEIVSGSSVGQIARSTVQDDGDGEREAILFFPPGTTASLQLPGGAITPAPSITVRATEYTVGADGRAAMPGPLPANVAYTYAVELSADEALAARAEHVLFSQPVYHYLDSFIPFPVGTAVPAAWYDFTTAAWMPSDDGRVIEILAANPEGLAGVDVDGSGAADAQTLEGMGFTEAELRQLALLYPVGHRIWRTPIEHFSPYDLNFPFTPPDDAEKPPEPVLKTNDDEPEGDQHDDDGSDDDESPVVPMVSADEPICARGSIIECENQVVRQRFEIVGTPYRLAYSSRRTPGWGADHLATYQVRGATVPASLEQIQFQIRGSGVVDGKRFGRSEFENRPFLEHRLLLPTEDAFGRPVHGQRRFRVHLGYTYPTVARSTVAEIARSWARFPDVDWVITEMTPFRSGFTLLTSVDSTYDQIFRNTFGTWDGRFQKLGGFTLDVHHAYDPVSRTLHRGDGSQRTARVVAPTLRRVAGTGEAGFSGDGGPATLARLNEPGSLAYGADGSLYFADGGNHRIRVVRPDGDIETFAGTGERCTLGGPGGPGDGVHGEEEPPETCDRDVPATTARINSPSALDLGPDGSLYFADIDQGCIYRIDRGGILRAYAGICRPGSGSGGPGSRPEGGSEPPIVPAPATEIELPYVYDLAVTSTGLVYVVDNQGLAQITPDGMFARVPGLSQIVVAITAGAGGELYLLDQFWKISRLRVDGVAETIAGGGEGPGLDGDPALASFLDIPTQLQYGRDGRIYFVEGDGIRVRRIEGDGTLKTVAGPRPGSSGGWSGGTPQAGDFLLGNRFNGLQAIAAGPEGQLVFADGRSAQIYESYAEFPDFIEDELKIAEGGQVYIFDDRGRHLRTRHALTGATLYEFGYDPQGLLVSVEDGSGNVTTIERDGSGQATAIVSPFGQRTELVMDGAGWLESLENPNHEKHTFLYRLGQMIEVEDPRGFKKKYEYSDLGRLTAMEDEAEERRTMSLIGRFGWPDSTVTMRGADSQKTQYTVRNRPDGSVYRSTRNPDGMLQISTRFRDGSTETQDRGILTYLKKRPDPRLGESNAYPAHSWVFMSENVRSETRSSIDTVLADPADPWSFEEIATVSETNGRLTSSLYTAATRSLVTVSPEGRSVRLELDELARPIEFEAPDTEAWKASYAETGEIEEITVGSGAEERKTLFGYDAFRRLETLVDAEERVVSFAYDDANRVISTVLPDLETVGFSYDGNGNVESVTPPGKPAHVFTYTARNQLETYTLPDAGSGTAVERREYDDSRRLEKVIRADGKEITFHYQPLSDRLSSIGSPRGTTTFDFDSTTGLVSEIVEPDGQKLEFEYEGLLLKRTTWTGEVNGSVGRTYDDDFRVTSIDVNGEDPIAYVYDDDGLLTQVGDMTITRDPATGRELTTQLGNVTTERTYTSFGEPESYTAKFSGTEIYYEHYTYNKLGWITDLERRQNGFNENLHYKYDDRGRLEEVWRDGVLESSYAYDDNSNRLSYTGPLGNATGTYDARDRMLTYGGASYTWSEAGELMTKTEGGHTTTYDYDVFGNLRKVELPNGIEIEYLTDGAQRRIGKKVNGVLVKQWLYLNSLEPVTELDGKGAIMGIFYYASRATTPDFMSSSEGVYRYVSDYFGSPRLIIESGSGSLLRDSRFDEFGYQIFNSDSSFQTFGFAGGIIDSHSGLTRFGARDYDSRTGRWSGVDRNGATAVESNQYLYCGADPVNFSDPTGLERGELIFFSRRPGSDFPYHVGFDVGNDQIAMLTQGQIAMVPLRNYLSASGYGVVGYGDLRPFITPAEFETNLGVATPALEQNFQNWQPSGTVCIDIVAAGLGSKAYPKFQDAIRADYSANQSAYPTAMNDSYFWRRNSTILTFFKNAGYYSKGSP